MKRILIPLVIPFLLAITSFSQESVPFTVSARDFQKIILVQPTGNYVDKYPEMVIIPDTSSLYLSTMNIIENSVINEILDLHLLAQVYLKNEDSTRKIEPAYLALTENQGGWAKTGFYLLQDGEQIDMTETPYVDLIQKTVSGDQNKLMSVTQLYPHELGHILYSLLSWNDFTDPEHRNVDMHYFTVITDYATAFNEGFAEHLENIARLEEKNNQIKQGIFSDITKIREDSPKYIRGFENDFLYPFRLGYYKTSMVIWFQKYEDYRRHAHAISGEIKYKNISPKFNDIEDRLSFRNAGVAYGDEPRNILQAISTEGVISSFFTKVYQSNIPKHYLSDEFYKPFLIDTSLTEFNPKTIFTPLQNQFIKYFVVIHNYVSKWNTSRSQFIDFMNGYTKAFPNEKPMILTMFSTATGRKFQKEIPPQIWLMAKDHEHRILALDPYGAITMPLYTFEFNAAETEDLLTIPGITEEEAETIIKYRNDEGFFNSLDEINNIEDLSDESKEIILNSSFDKDYLKGLSTPELELSALIYKPIKILIIKILAYFAVFLIILQFLFRKDKVSTKNNILKSIGYFFMWILFVCSALALVVFNMHPLLISIGILLGFLIIGFLIFRKNKWSLIRAMLITSLMGLIVIMSLI